MKRYICPFSWCGRHFWTQRGVLRCVRNHVAAWPVDLTAPGRPSDSEATDG